MGHEIRIHDVRYLLRQLRDKPDADGRMEHELVGWFEQWHKAGRRRENRAEKAAGKIATVSDIFTRCQP